MALQRGLNNNNPGNIVKDSQVWLGEVVPSTDVRFKQFRTRAHGYRAIFVNLSSYIRKGHNTIQKIITRWAPAFENNTASYIAHVSAMSGIGKDTPISVGDNVALGYRKKKVLTRLSLGIVAVGLITAGIYLAIKGKKNG